ncbi:formate transporter FocA [Enterovibrio nigricans]|uniref:Formate transporter FocA n=1 Tax=Enterovibrio nigricans DSM 22720 TaxID=1121868 RepID=A0A1T4UNF3_9GAMM|nr:formate transporter FocA [Enterovibrio nigricans]PKF50605.1 formate transporter FocA [Enterovibrio nigricans]SKA54130.1 formate transporter FocA [Enterovibrio nigricans DSM 22720]
MTTAYSDHDFVSVKGFSASEMMAEAERYALKKISKRSGATISLAILAGAFIGLAFLFYTTVTTGNDGTSWGLNRLAGGLAFSMGLILIVIFEGELFTSTVLSSISWANNQVGIGKLLSTWGKVYFGNFLGAMLVVLLVSTAGMYQLDGGQWGLNALNVAQHKLHHTWLEAFTLGVLCNILVCTAIWLTFCSANPIVKAAMTMLPVAMFVSSGFEHSIANMFMVPLGIVIANFSPDSFWAGVGVNASQYADLTINHFLVNNLVPVTLGNILGGAVLVGLANWGIYRKQLLQTEVLSINVPVTINKASKDSTMMNNLKVKDLMNKNPIVLKASDRTSDAIDILLAHNLTGAPVCDSQQFVVGFFSVHDAMVNLWCEDYLPDAKQCIGELMRDDVTALNSEENVIDVAEFLVMDKEKVFPVSPMGIATTFSTLSLKDRVKEAKISKPHILPVLEHGKLVGVISRSDVLQALRPLYDNAVEEPHLAQVM